MVTFGLEIEGDEGLPEHTCQRGAETGEQQPGLLGKHLLEELRAWRGTIALTSPAARPTMNSSQGTE